jgi:hypothetical protein
MQAVFALLSYLLGRSNNYSDGALLSEVAYTGVIKLHTGRTSR